MPRPRDEALIGFNPKSCTLNYIGQARVPNR